jgi:hypothetical protein
MKALDSVQSIRATYLLEMLTFLQFGFQVFCHRTTPLPRMSTSVAALQPLQLRHDVAAQIEL